MSQKGTCGNGEGLLSIGGSDCAKEVILLFEKMTPEWLEEGNQVKIKRKSLGVGNVYVQRA